VKFSPRTGFKVHFTETGDSDRLNLLLEGTTTSATKPDGDVLEDLHTRLAEKKVLPSQHLVDKGQVHAEMLAKSQQMHQIEIIGPALPDTSWSSKDAERFDHSDFSIDWDFRKGKTSERETSGYLYIQ
jgi:transposase